jgi:serine/threonine protein kinase
VQMIANMAERVCDLHARGWVHRDLKPANIMWLPRTNRWTVIDFGCAAPRGAPLLSIPAELQSALKAISYCRVQKSTTLLLNIIARRGIELTCHAAWPRVFCLYVRDRRRLVSLTS